MKKLLFILFLSSFSNAFSEDLNIATNKEIQKTNQNAQVIEVDFGVLPNSDKGVNNRANLTINYNHKLSSSITYKTSSIANNSTEEYPAEEVGDFPSTSVSTGIIDLTVIDLTLIKYKDTVFKRGKSHLIYWGYLDFSILKEYETSNYIESGSAGTESERITGTEKNNLKGSAPSIGAGFSFERSKFIFKSEGKFLFLNKYKNDWNDKGSAFSIYNDGGLQTENIAFDLTEKAKYDANGWGASVSMEYSLGKIGTPGIHLSQTRISGDAKISSRETANGTTETTSVTKELIRTFSSIRISYALDFLKPLGVVPVLSFGKNYRKVKIGGIISEDDDQNEYGIFFKYNH